MIERDNVTVRCVMDSKEGWHREKFLVFTIHFNTSMQQLEQTLVGSFLNSKTNGKQKDDLSNFIISEIIYRKPYSVHG